jgi:N-terminal domain of toast_rack, DUF2154
MFARISLVSLLLLTSCGWNIEDAGTRPTQTDHQKIAKDKSEMARVEFTMAAGQLNVSAGTNELMEGDFTYNIPTCKPDIRYNNSSFRSVLQIEQHASGSSGRNIECKWDVHLNEAVPMDIFVKLGAGQAQFNLGSLALRGVEVEVGAGEIKLDLRGTPKRDYNVKVRGGVGEATIWVPRSARVIAEASGGIGGIQVRGFEKRDGRYENSADPRAQTTIHLDVKGGVGAINLYSE